MRREQSDRLAASVVEFGRFLRLHGSSTDPSQTITALEAIRTIHITDHHTFAFALQAALCSTPEEWERFPALFGEFWEEQEPRPRSSSGEYKGHSKRSTQTREVNATVFLDQPGKQTHSMERNGETKAVYGASVQHQLRKVDFSDVPCDDLVLLEELSLRLLRRLSLRLSRRRALSNFADHVDLRRTIRRNISHGGEPIVLAYKARKLRKNKLVIFLDVSGSMNFYSLFLVRFAYALQARLQRVRTFLFSTEVVEISDLLSTRHLQEALRRLSQRAVGWSGGTRIGESLRQLNQLYGRNLLSRDTVFIILSDGWDTGEPEMLASQMRAIQRRAQRVLWLNPLLGLKDYQPITRAMAAALPYVDIFAPAHNLESLLALERYL